MTLDAYAPVRDLADRAMRQSLCHPENLRSFLEQVVPHLAPGFDCANARLLEREFPTDDWRHREADLPFEVPYRTSEATLAGALGQRDYLPCRGNIDAAFCDEDALP